MRKIKAILIDDEEKALEGLQLKVKRFFPNIEILEEVTNPKTAIKLLNNLKPDLVFIDIEMPVLSGFDVLSKIENPNFEIIFVTAYNNYAIEAIQHCAIGYIVKPIDNDELKQAINNALKNIDKKSAYDKNIELLAHLGHNKQTSIAIPTKNGLNFVKTKNIIRFEGVEGYTKIFIKDETAILSSYSIGKFIKLLTNNDFFVVHKSHFVNLNFIKSILKEGTILFYDNHTVPLIKTKRATLIERMEKL